MRIGKLALTAALAAALAAGCGPTMLRTKGKLLKGGAPLTVPEGE